jgi:hypothetical protein
MPRLSSPSSWQVMPRSAAAFHLAGQHNGSVLNAHDAQGERNEKGSQAYPLNSPSCIGTALAARDRHAVQLSAEKR